MSVQKGLTDEQKQRIADNKQRALAKLAKKATESNANNSGKHFPNDVDYNLTITHAGGLKPLSTVSRSISSVSNNASSVSNNASSVSNKTSFVRNSTHKAPLRTNKTVPLIALINKVSAEKLNNTCVTSLGSRLSPNTGLSSGAHLSSSTVLKFGTGLPGARSLPATVLSSSATRISAATGLSPGTELSLSTELSSGTGPSSVNIRSNLTGNRPAQSHDCSKMSSNFYGNQTDAVHVQQKSISSAGNFYGSKARVSLQQTNISNSKPSITSLCSNRHNVSNRNMYNSVTNNSSSVSNLTFSPEKKVVRKPLLGEVKGSCVLSSRERFHVEVGFHPIMVEVFKTIKSKQYDAVNKQWSFKLEDHEDLIQKLRPLRPEVDISPLPAVVKSVFKQQFSGKYPAPRVPEADLSTVDPVLSEGLLPFQKTGVSFGVSRKGRVLIADDMGLGKTIQAICIACYYRHEWPLLVVVPSSVRYDWAEQLRRWVPSLDPQKIKVIQKFKEDTSSASVVIVSYTVMAKKVDELKKRNFEIIIMDESHLLKDRKSSRTKASLTLLQTAKRVILLSGTPCLSRPSELFTQIVAISPGFFKFHDFGVRYCEGKQAHWGWDYSGCSNLGELQLILEEKFLIRRLKCDVLSQLPSKQRKMVLLDPSSIKLTKHLKEAASCSEKKINYDRRSELLNYFHETATSKVGAVRNYVLELLESGHKFLLFAHHQELLDAVETAIKDNTSDSYMRIDGKTNPEQRKVNCDRFQTCESVRVALLSITAANAGINLTAASLVVFAELFWNPGILVQAEDRVHRIGQQDSVNVHYLVAPGTADDHIWPLVQKKLEVLSKTGLSKEDFSEADTFRQTKPGHQKGIKEFWEESFFDTDVITETLEEIDTEGNNTVIKSPTKSPARKHHQEATNKSPRKSPRKQTGIQQFFKQTSPNKVGNPSVTNQSEFDDELDKPCDWLDMFEEWEDMEPSAKKLKTS